MAQYIVVKKKNGIFTVETTKCNLKRAKLVANHPFDKFASYMICEIVDEFKPVKNEIRESL